MKKRKPTAAETAELEAKRTFIYDLLASSGPEHHTAAEKLALLSLLFSKKTFSPEQKFEIDSMGVLLGDALCQFLPLEWVSIEYEGEEEMGLSFADSNVFCHPISMIRKRIIREEEVDVFYMFVGTAESLATAKRES